MEIRSPGEGILADKSGVVTSVSPDRIRLNGSEVHLKVEEPLDPAVLEEGVFVFPIIRSWQEPAVEVGQRVNKKEVIARGVTHVYFQANVWIFTGLVFVAGIMMGIGKAAVYKHIPEYFPSDVGVVGGLVGVIGGLGGFVCPILFGYMLRATGPWTSCCLFLAVVTIISLVSMHLVILRMTKGQTSPR